MAIERVTANDFASIIAEGVNDRDATIDTRIGPVRDLFIDPVANVLEQQNNRMIYLNKLSSLRNASEVIPDDLDDVVFNEGLVRKDGSSSVVVLTFARAQAPTSDIVIPVNFPISTVVDPDTGNSILFKTTETVTMYSASASQYYNANTGKYEIDVSARSVVQGVESQVGANTITVFRRNFSQFDEVTNKEATSSGSAIETNLDLADRYLLHIKGSQLSTPNGLKSFLLDNIISIDDAYVVYGTDSYLTREESDAGAVDVWLKGTTEVTTTYNTFYPGTETLIEVNRQPLVRVTTVSTTAGGGVTFTEGTDYEIVTGEGEFSYSNVGMDGIKFIAGGTHPDPGDDLAIVYVHNSLISLTDSYFKQNEYFSMGMDRLFRWAQPKDIYIEASLKVRFGAPSNVLLSVRSAIVDYFEDYELGDDVEEFDIDRVVSGVSGVDNWTYDILDVAGGTGVGDIEIGPNEYARLLTSNLVINLV
jgi:hypothetical protein